MIELDEFEIRRNRGSEPELIIRGEAHIPADPRGTVVICHGFKGFAHWAFFPYLAAQLAAGGLCAVTFDFSGSGIGDDRENFTNPNAFTANTYRQELDDLEAVLGKARESGWIEDRYGLFGHSRGGGVAVMRASVDENLKALVTWAAISSTNRWTTEAAAEWRRSGFTNIHNARTGQTIPLSTALLDEVEAYGETNLNVASAASRISVPWLIVHGSADETVAVSEGERLHRLSPSSSTLRVIDGANHAFDARHPLTETPPALTTATSETVSFFAEHLQQPRM